MKNWIINKNYYMILDVENFNCNTCPALYLKSKQIEQIKCWESIREEAIRAINSINIYLLGESIPEKRFFYDKNTDYSHDGLRYYVRKELVKNGTDEELFGYMTRNGIVLVDCAVCPLYKIKQDNDRVIAATFCLARNTQQYLKMNSEAPIITIFPLKGGFAKNSLLQIEKRIVGKFQFTRLNGLKALVENVLKNSAMSKNINL